MIRATGAKLRMLASDAVLLFAFVLFGVDNGGEMDEWGEEDDMSLAARRPFLRHTSVLSGSGLVQQREVIRRRDARLGSM